MANTTHDTTPTTPASCERVSTPVHNMDEDLFRLTAVLEWLETHGDDDTFGLVSIVRPYVTSLGNHLDCLRTAVH